MLKILVSSLWILMSSCALAQAEPSVTMSLQEMKRRNPEAEAQKALQRGDRRLLGVYAYSLEVPGAGIEIDEAESRFGVVAIEGTTDFYETAAVREFNEAARDYATRYNRYIVRHAP